jgi:copper transport protein
MGRQNARRLWRSLAALLVVSVLSSLALLGLAAPASAHASLIGTSPRPDQVLAAAPADVVLTFNDAVDLKTATLQVLEPSGSPLAIGLPAHLGNDQTSLTVSLPKALGPGTRTVLYRVVSSDGHPVQGSFRFSVGAATASSATPDALVSGESGLGLFLGMARWVAFVGLALAVGTMLLVVLAWPGGLAVRAVRRMLWFGVGALGIASVGSLLLYGPYVEGNGLSGVLGDLDYGLSTRIGKLLVLRLVLLAAAVVTLRIWLRRSRGAARVGGPVPVVATLGVGGALALTWTLATHSADGGGRMFMLPIDLVHLLAMSAWLGGMPALLVLLLQVRDADALARAVPMFSRTATICVVALVATGVIQAWRQVGSTAALTSTSYGDWLMIKVGLVVGIVAIGGFSRWWATPHLAAAQLAPEGRAARRKGVATARDRAVSTGSTRLGRLVAMETGLGAVVLAVTATLVATQPAEAAHKAELAALSSAKTNRAMLAASPTDATIGFRLAQVTTGQEPVVYRTPLAVPPGSPTGRGYVQAVISPAFGGLPNELHVSVTDDQGRPLPVGSVLVDLRAVGTEQRSAQNPLSSTGQGHFFSAFTVPREGKWELGITVKDIQGNEALVIIPFEAKVSAT